MAVKSAKLRVFKTENESAQRHFGCSANQLRRSDCALVAATLPNPIRFSSLSPSKYMRKRQQQIQREMRLIPFFNKSK